jgi:hypothetical protein
MQIARNCEKQGFYVMLSPVFRFRRIFRFFFLNCKNAEANLVEEKTTFFWENRFFSSSPIEVVVP